MTQHAGWRRGRRRLLVWLFGLCAISAVSFASATSHAQRAFYLDRVQIGGAPDDGLFTRRAYMSPETRLYASTALGFAVNPLRASTVAASSSVEEKIENLIEAQLLSYFSAGVEIGGRVAFGLTVPVAWIQSGGDVPIAGSRPPSPSLFPVDTGSSLYDVSLETRVRIFGDEQDWFRIGVGGALFIPTGTFARGGSDDLVTLYLYTALEQELGPILLAGSIGPHFRPLRGIDGTDSQLDVGSEIRINGAGFLDLQERLRVGAEINGMVGFAENETGASTFLEAPATPFEWAGFARLLLGSRKHTYLRASAGTRMSNGYGAPDLRIMFSVGHWALLSDVFPEDETRLAGQGPRQRPVPPVADPDTDSDGYPDSIDPCPDVAEDGKEPFPTDGCPADSDRDHDGVVDIKDECPTDPEDRDGIQDEDGCPEKDADEDGVWDARDACPLVAGIEYGDPQRDGCPKPKRTPTKLVVEEETGELRLLEPVQFETGTAELKEASHALLDEVVEVMVDAPEIRIAVHGHTDSRGSLELNRGLSQARAEAVVKYLTDAGVALERLSAEGFGPDRPIDTNETEAGRAKNRRVEFKIVPPSE